MSADSPKRAVRSVPTVVPPQVVSDRSIIDSVAGFINDVTLTNQPQVDPKDQILWARFENLADISDPTCGEDWELEGHVAPPLVLILGYGSGIQVWTVPANGEAVEVLSWRHGSVKALRILPTPISADDEMAAEPIDQFADQRPLMALCDSTSSSCSPQYCSANFVSLKNGAQVKTIKFKNPVIDILANRTSIVITFQERIAVFDARNLEDRLSITSCHPSPGINPNPIALGTRWMAYSEWKLLPSKRSSGGCDCDGVSSYTATVLNAAKSLGKGLRELGEQVAAGLTGTAAHGSNAPSSKSNSFDSNTGEIKQPGMITILDIKYSIKEVSPTTGSPISATGTDPIVAHFIAHSDAIVALEFDVSGMLLLTADKRGHDFHVFRIQPHPAGPHLASVHHLYVLHRGDTSAKVQDIVFSLDSRWVAVSSLRGTTHVFPITPYGGPSGVRTHGSLHVVNRLSRFHRSAGLSADGRSSSPISHSENTFNQSCMPYNNPRTPPFPRPTVVLPLAQLRQPSVLGTPPGSAQNSYSRSTAGRQRLSSLSDDSGKPLRVCAVFAKARSWLLDPPNLTRETPAHRMQRKVVDSLFIMAGHGALIQYDLDAKLASNVAKEKVCDDTPIELEVEAKAQWCLGRKETSSDIQPPLSPDNWLMKERNCYSNSDIETNSKDSDDRNDRWLSQVEIITHAGPHRRLWMGPQFVFKTYNTPSGAPLSHIDVEAVEIGVNSGGNRPGRSSPMNMPITTSNKAGVPVLIESGSYSEFPSSFEQSPKLMDRFRHGHMDSDFALAHGESRLKEDLADAMRESPSAQHKDTGLTPVSMSSQTTSQSGLTSSTDMHSISPQSSVITTVIQKPIQPPRSAALIEKVVNPLGTVTTITRSPSENDFDTNNSNIDFADDYIIHENCDEALFRPVVAIFCDDSTVVNDKRMVDSAYIRPPETVGTELIVPVTEEPTQKPFVVSTVNKKSNKTETKKESIKCEEKEQIAKFNEMSLVNKKNKNGKKSRPEKERSPPVEETKLSSENDKLIAAKSLKLNKQEKPKKEPSNELRLNSEQDDKNTQHKKDDTVVSLTSSLSASSQKTNKYDEEIERQPIKKKSEKYKSEPVKIASVKEPSPEIVSKVKEKIPAADIAKEILVESAKILDKSDISSDNQTIEVLDSGTSKMETSFKLRKDKDKSKVTHHDTHPITKTVTVTSKSEDVALKFYDKFVEDDSKSATIEPKRQVETVVKSQTENIVEYPSITESITDVKRTKKHKSSSPSPKQSPKLATKIRKHEPAEKLENLPNDIEVVETFTLSLTPKKKSKKSVEDEAASKKSFVISKTSVDATNSTDISGKLDKLQLDEKAKKSGKFSKTQDISKLSFEIISSPDYVEKYLPPLSPLEPFEPKFDNLHFNATPPELVSLINFESPLQEKEIPVVAAESIVVKKNKTATIAVATKTSAEEECKQSSSQQKYTQDNLIFALCGSLHEGESHEEEEATPIKLKTTTATDRSIDGIEINDIDEQYLSLEPTIYHENTSSTSSSEDTEESSCNQDKKRNSHRDHHLHDKMVHRDDDEELRPLISGANSACSMTSSTGVVGINSSKETDDSTIALEIAKAISDSLPENNHSDSSDQANPSQTADDLDDDIPILSSTAATEAAKTSSGQANCCTGGSSNANQQNTNGKKKSKRKKR